MDKKYLSMAEATKLCSYDQEYLSLLARKGELKADKIGRNWYTTIDWLNEYIKLKKPNELIEESVSDVRENIRRQAWYVWALEFLLVVLIVFGIFAYLSNRIKNLEKNKEENQFVPEEIIKVPNDNGNYDVYGVGRKKIGEENVSNQP